jgi:hypothetical protein
MPPLARLELGEGVEPAVKIKTLTKNELAIKKIPLNNYK